MMMFFALIIMLRDTCFRFLNETITFQFICIICVMLLVLCTVSVKRSIFFKITVNIKIHFDININIYVHIYKSLCTVRSL